MTSDKEYFVLIEMLPTQKRFTFKNNIKVFFFFGEKRVRQCLKVFRKKS